MLFVQIVAGIVAVVIAYKYLMRQPEDGQVIWEGKDGWYLIFFLVCLLLAMVPIVIARS